jgi:H+/Cl- antiporter ClcA
VIRTSAGVAFFAALVILIVWRMIDRLWGESLLSTVGSRHTPLWLSWTILGVLLAVCGLLLWVCVRDLYRALRALIAEPPTARSRE